MSLLEPYVFIMLVAYAVAAAVAVLTGYHPVVGTGSMFMLGVMPGLAGMVVFAILAFVTDLSVVQASRRGRLLGSLGTITYTVMRMTLWAFGPLSFCVLLVSALAVGSALASPTIGASDLLVAAVLVPALLMPVAAAIFMLGAVLFETVITLPFKSGAAR
jgi:hypothetical protein